MSSNKTDHVNSHFGKAKYWALDTGLFPTRSGQQTEIINEWIHLMVSSQLNWQRCVWKSPRSATLVEDVFEANDQDCISEANKNFIMSIYKPLFWAQTKRERKLNIDLRSNRHFLHHIQCYPLEHVMLCSGTLPKLKLKRSKLNHRARIF